MPGQVRRNDRVLVAQSLCQSSKSLARIAVAMQAKQQARSPTPPVYAEATTWEVGKM